MATYQQLTETLQKIRRSEEKLKVLIDNKADLEAKVREKKIALDKENYDVEKLEGLSLEGFIHLLKGTLIDKLDKEEREAMIAKNQYEFACQELEVCIKEISRCQARVKDKYTVERAYETFIKDQESKLLRVNSKDARLVKDLMDKLYYNSEIIREIREANEAGGDLYDAFECIQKSFENAEDLGVVQVLGNGLLVSECGNEVVKSSNEQLVLIQQHIRRYHLEVLDVLDVCDLDLDISRLLEFSDCFLVRVINGASLDEKIQEAMKLLGEMMRLIKESINSLNLKKQEIESLNKGLKENKIQLIEAYLDEIGGIDEKSS